MRIRHTLLSGWLLIGLLLAGQFSLLVHETDHASLAASTPCVFCLSHSTFEGAAPASIIAIAVNLAGTDVIAYQAPALPVSRLLIAPEPRAPPRLS